MRTWANVAELSKTKTLTGGLVARCAPGLPFLLEEGMEVAFVPPRHDAPRRARVLSVQDAGRDAFLVTFEGVDSIDVAELLVGCSCLVRRADLPESALAAEADGLEGFEVRDARAGFVGVVESVVENPGQFLLSVAPADGGRRVLVPLVDALVVGLALFAMFFGAGNLIFPPYLGMESGTLWPLGLACFVFFDVVVSCVGVFAINNAGGSILSIQNALGKKAGLALNTAAILCVGMLIAPPRCAATTFEMAIAPWFGDAIGLLPFSVAFFAVVLLLTLKPTRIIDVVGKVLTPLLVAGIVVMVIAGIVNPLGPVGSPETDAVVADGVLAGYQTMDILAVVGFSILVQESVRAAGYGEKRDQMRVTARASLVACVLLAVIYGGLTYLGATSASVVPHTVSQAELITMIVWKIMGEAGVAVLGVVVGLACLTTAIGLCGATADYVERVTMRRVSYRAALIIVVVAALLICNLGLTNIIALASPILSVVCPPFMTTVVLLLFRKHLRGTWVFKGAALAAVAASLLLTVHDLTGAFAFVEAAPLYAYGFAWLLPSLVGGAAGALLGRRFDSAASG